MDIASLIGMVLGVVMIVFGIISGDAGVSALQNFFDLPSVIITIGGSLAGVIGCNLMSDFVNGLKSITLIFKGSKDNPGDVIKSIIDLSNVARKEGLLALDEASNGIEDAFLRKGVMLVVDGTDPELVRGILETDLICIEDRHKTVIAFWEKWAELGPAWGMIGTLIGLVNMLKNLTDSSTIGPNMAVALLTTMYGSVIANWLCNPTASKLKVKNSQEIMMKEVIVEGLLSIQAGENPRVIEEKLKSFLSPKVRESLSSDSGGEG
ncbi:MAG: motility protein A [Lachnospiraceae bacterium]|nr:motility protein A [Lachnospiraceae bacterium]